MPTVLRLKGYRVSFFVADADEPAHVHVSREKMEAKFWLAPFVRLAKNKGFRPHDLNVIERLLAEHQDELLETWNAYFES
jgi:hypothetical protein